MHLHPAHDEHFEILEGRLSVDLGDSIEERAPPLTQIRPTTWKLIEALSYRSRPRKA